MCKGTGGGEGEKTGKEELKWREKRELRGPFREENKE